MNLENLKTCKILKLTLSKKPFDVMATGEKDIEIRRPSKWLKSRLYAKDGSERSYDYVQFTNGYGSTKPMFIAEYLYFFEVDKESEEILNFSNGLVVEMSEGCIVIVLGSILQTIKDLQSKLEFLCEKLSEICNSEEQFMSLVGNNFKLLT